MTTWRSNKAWADRFIPEIVQCVAPHVIVVAAPEDDEQRNTDLIVLRGETKRIGCRVRRHGFLERFGSEFTIRYSVPSRAKTELSKLIAGWGDLFFYGHSDATEERLAAWVLLNLYEFRKWYAIYLHTHAGELPGRRVANPDGSTFSAIDIRALDKAVIVEHRGMCLEVSDGLR